MPDAAATPRSPVDMSAPLPPSHPPIGKPPTLTFAAPDGWVAETPSSSMRKAQFVLPRQEDDTEDARLVVFFFGPGQGGGVEDNLQRWASEYIQPDGRPPLEAAQRSARKINGLDVTEIDVSGTLVAETQPGSGERVNKPEWRTLAAIVETDLGSYFVKLMGPKKTIEHWAPSFRQYLSSATVK